MLVILPNKKEGEGHQPNTLRLVRQELWRLCNDPLAERYTGRYLARVATWAAAYERGIRRALRQGQKGRRSSGSEKVWKLVWQVEGQNAVALAGLVALDAPHTPAVASAVAASTSKPKKKTKKERRTERKAVATEQARVAKQLDQRAYEFCRSCPPPANGEQAALGSAACLLWWQQQSAGPPKRR